MKKGKELVNWIVIALYAAIYAVITIAFAGISYGAVQFRLSEMMNHFVVFDKRFIAGITLGVVMSNFGSSFGIVDVIVGSLTTLVCTLLAAYAGRFSQKLAVRLAINVFIFAVIGMLPIAIMITFGNLATTWAVYVGLVVEESIVMIVGAIVVYVVDKKIDLTRFFEKLTR